MNELNNKKEDRLKGELINLVRTLYENRNHHDNKFFAKACAVILELGEISENSINILTNLGETNKVIARNHKYSFSILKKIDSSEVVSNRQTYVNGKQRYYSERHFIKGSEYIISNDWYYPGEGKVGTKDTKTPFLDWIMKKLTFGDKL